MQETDGNIEKTQGNIKKTQGNFRKTQGFFAKTQPNRQIYLFMNSELWRKKKPDLGPIHLHLVYLFKFTKCSIQYGYSILKSSTQMS